MEVVQELGVEDVAIVGIAKGPHHGRDGREVFHFPDGREKQLPVNSPVLFHLQRLRDEVHRFVIGAHRDKRSRAITASPLDEIPGIGPARKRALLLHFGTASRVRAAALDDLKRAPGVSEVVAQTVYDFYHPGVKRMMRAIALALPLLSMECIAFGQRARAAAPQARNSYAVLSD
jgi:excinuclease ABC subunit C